MLKKINKELDKISKKIKIIIVLASGLSLIIYLTPIKDIFNGKIKEKVEEFKEETKEKIEAKKAEVKEAVEEKKEEVKEEVKKVEDKIDSNVQKVEDKIKDIKKVKLKDLLD